MTRKHHSKMIVFAISGKLPILSMLKNPEKFVRAKILALRRRVLKTSSIPYSLGSIRQTYEATSWRRNRKFPLCFVALPWHKYMITRDLDLRHAQRYLIHTSRMTRGCRNCRFCPLTAFYSTHYASFLNNLPLPLAHTHIPGPRITFSLPRCTPHVTFSRMYTHTRPLPSILASPYMTHLIAE